DLLDKIQWTGTAALSYGLYLAGNGQTKRSCEKLFAVSPASLDNSGWVTLLGSLLQNCSGSDTYASSWAQLRNGLAKTNIIPSLSHEDMATFISFFAYPEVRALAQLSDWPN